MYSVAEVDQAAAELLLAGSYLPESDILGDPYARTTLKAGIIAVISESIYHVCVEQFRVPMRRHSIRSGNGDRLPGGSSNEPQTKK